MIRRMHLNLGRKAALNEVCLTVTRNSQNLGGRCLWATVCVGDPQHTPVSVCAS